MGLDAVIYAEATPTPAELEQACGFFRRRTEIARVDPDDLPGATPRQELYIDHPGRVEVNTWHRFYGVGYERGHWPELYAAIRALQAAFPGAPVFYGADCDDYGAACTPEFLEATWRHYLSPKGLAYYD